MDSRAGHSPHIKIGVWSTTLYFLPGGLTALCSDIFPVLHHLSSRKSWALAMHVACHPVPDVAVL